MYNKKFNPKSSIGKKVDAFDRQHRNKKSKDKELESILAAIEQDGIYVRNLSNERFSPAVQAFLSNLANRVVDYDDITAKNISETLLLDAVITKKFQAEMIRLKKRAYRTDKKLVEAQKYSYPRLLDFYKRRFNKKDTRFFITDRADLFAKTYSQEKLFPYFVFAQLIDHTLTNEFQTIAEIGDEECKEYSFYRPIEKMCTKRFFKENADERDFNKSMWYIQMFYMCLRNESYFSQGRVLSAPETGIKKDVNFKDISEMPYPLRRKVLEEKVFGSLQEEDLPHGIIHDCALNLYCFNSTSLLLDWMLVINKVQPIILELEGMLFAKDIPIPWDTLEPDQRKKSVKVLSRMYTELLNELPEPTSDSFRTIYNECENALNIRARSIVAQLQDFHYGYAQLINFEDANTREHPQAILYKEMVRRQAKAFAKT